MRRMREGCVFIRSQVLVMLQLCCFDFSLELFPETMKLWLSYEQERQIKTNQAITEKPITNFVL